MPSPDAHHPMLTHWLISSFHWFLTPSLEKTGNYQDLLPSPPSKVEHSHKNHLSKPLEVGDICLDLLPAISQDKLSIFIKKSRQSLLRVSWKQPLYLYQGRGKAYILPSSRPNPVGLPWVCCSEQAKFIGGLWVLVFLHSWSGKKENSKGVTQELFQVPKDCYRNKSAKNIYYLGRKVCCLSSAHFAHATWQWHESSWFNFSLVGQLTLYGLVGKELTDALKGNKS